MLRKHPRIMSLRPDEQATRSEFYESERPARSACGKTPPLRDAAGLHLALRESVDTFRGATPARDDITVLVIEYAPE